MDAPITEFNAIANAMPSVRRIRDAYEDPDDRRRLIAHGASEPVQPILWRYGARCVDKHWACGQPQRKGVRILD